METNLSTTDLSEASPLYYFTDNNNNTHPVFALPNTQTFQNHHQYSCSYNPLPHQYRIINNSQPQFDHQFSQLWQHRLAREPRQQPAGAAAVAHCHESRHDTMIGHSRPAVNNYCFKLGLSNESNSNYSTNDEEYSYSTAATKEPFHWNGYTAMDDIIPNFAQYEKNNKVDDVMMRENINVCNNIINDKEVVGDERKQFMRFYGELEAIYGLAKNNNNVNLGETSYNQTGSSSALTSENSPVGASLPDDPTPFCDDKEGCRRNELHKKKRKRKRKELFRSTTGFFEGLVENVMSHQDRLHRKFMEAIERLDRERSEREEAWRRREAQAQSREADARVHEQAMASTREAIIVSYLEKITGQRVDLPRSIMKNNNNPAALLSWTNSTSKVCSKNLFDGFGVQRQSYVELLKGFTTQANSSSTSVGKLFEVSEMAGSRKLNFDNKEEFEDEFIREDEEDNLDTNNEDWKVIYA